MTIASLFEAAARVGAQLKARRETVAVAESAAGGGRLTLLCWRDGREELPGVSLAYWPLPAT